MTSLITQIPAFTLSSALPDLSWSTDQEEVHVRLYYQSTANMLLDTALTAVNGKVSLYETRQLVEQYMMQNGMARLYPLQIMHEEEGYWQGDGAMTVIYCEKNIKLLSQQDSVGQWLERNFLSTLTTKPLPSDENTIEQLYFVHPQGTPSNPALHVSFYDAQGTVQSADVTLTASYNASQTNLFVCEFSIAAIKATVAEAVSIIAVTVSVDSRHMEYYRPARHENIAFRFRNAFNVFESAYFSASINRKTDDGRKLANVAGSLALYDRKPVTEYEVQTSPLSFEEASWIDQLITSSEVTLLDGTPVIITDGTAECHNDNAEMNSAKFSYKELDQRQTMSYVKPVNIFTVPPHSYQFA